MPQQSHHSSRRMAGGRRMRNNGPSSSEGGWRRRPAQQPRRRPQQHQHQDVRRRQPQPQAPAQQPRRSPQTHAKKSPQMAPPKAVGGGSNPAAASARAKQSDREVENLYYALKQGDHSHSVRQAMEHVNIASLKNIAATACKFGRTKSMLVLLDDGGLGVDTRLTQFGDHTGLHLAAACGSKSLVRALIQRRASVNITNQAGETPRDIAAARGHSEVVRLLDDAAARAAPKPRPEPPTPAMMRASPAAPAPQPQSPDSAPKSNKWCCTAAGPDGTLGFRMRRSRNNAVRATTTAAPRPAPEMSKPAASAVHKSTPPSSPEPRTSITLDDQIAAWAASAATATATATATSVAAAPQGLLLPPPQGVQQQQQQQPASWSSTAQGPDGTTGFHVRRATATAVVAPPAAPPTTSSAWGRDADLSLGRGLGNGLSLGTNFAAWQTPSPPAPADEVAVPALPAAPNATTAPAAVVVAPPVVLAPKANRPTTKVDARAWLSSVAAQVRAGNITNQEDLQVFKQGQQPRVEMPAPRPPSPPATAPHRAPETAPEAKPEKKPSGQKRETRRAVRNIHKLTLAKLRGPTREGVLSHITEVLQPLQAHSVQRVINGCVDRAVKEPSFLPVFASLCGGLLGSPAGHAAGVDKLLAMALQHSWESHQKLAQKLAQAGVEAPAQFRDGASVSTYSSSDNGVDEAKGWRSSAGSVSGSVSSASSKSSWASRASGSSRSSSSSGGSTSSSSSRGGVVDVDSCLARQQSLQRLIAELTRQQSAVAVSKNGVV